MSHSDNWEVVIGLEIHCQLATKTKIFSGASTAYGAEPNTQACSVDLALPGVLPVFNKEALRLAVKFGLAIGAEIGMRSVFDRKNYFYPDSPKAYQITQMDLPIVGVGYVDVDLENGETKRVGVTRAHLEEDAGKSMHGVVTGMTGIDLNRAGTPLIEIVSEPDMRSAKEAVAYMKKIHSLVQYIEISDGNMQEGSFRCDANVSVRPKGQEEFGTRAEIKNINSFRFVERAINHEIERQIDLIEDGGTVVQETRLYDADKDETRSMRSKEEANDYRYFPDPDLLPVVIDEEYLEKVRSELPELPDEKKARYISEYSLSITDAASLTASRVVAEYFETVASVTGNVKLSANWVLGALLAKLNKEEVDISEAKVDAKAFALLLQRIADNTVSASAAKDVFDAMWNGEGDADEIIDAKGLKQISDSSAIEAMVDEVIANNQGQFEELKAGKDKLMGFFVGQIMKASKGKANPGQVNAIINKRIKGE